VGIFSLFGKKDKQPARKPTEAESSHKKREDSRVQAAKSENDYVQRMAAHATAMKIDAIESEMSSEFVKPLPFSGNTMPGPASQFLNTNVRGPDTQTTKVPDTATHLGQPSMLPDIMGASTAFLLGAETVIGPVAISKSEAPLVIEEAAILFANGQTNLIEPVLLNAIAEDTSGDARLTVWGMLFDLYQITGQRNLFENLSIEFANKFEMSPPTWREGSSADSGQVPAPRNNTIPSIAFPAKLDAGIIKQLERIKNVAEMSPVLKLEFARVTQVDPVGCGLLLNILKRLQKSGHKLILVGAPELAEKIQAILLVGRRDETEAPWLLLLEVLRLLNREADFEERSIDYCITFEVSPPAFVSPQDKVTTDHEETAVADETSSDHFIMPVLIDARSDTLGQNIAAYAHTHDPVILDCSQLIRMDFNAAGRLFGDLMPLIGSGKTIELHSPNHFIVALCNVMGMTNSVRIVPRKN
jgi:anti-anti-sigma regulatory factor